MSEIISSIIMWYYFLFTMLLVLSIIQLVISCICGDIVYGRNDEPDYSPLTQGEYENYLLTRSQV